MMYQFSTNNNSKSNKKKPKISPSSSKKSRNKNTNKTTKRSLKTIERTKMLLLASQMKNFEDSLNPCFKRILGFSYEGFVDFADVFRGANVTNKNSTNN